MKSETEPNVVFAVVAADAVCFRIIDEKLHVLLGKAPKHSPFPGEWALIGGMLHPQETAEEAVSRLLKEKAGIKNTYKEQVYTFSRIDRDPRGRVVSIAYLALNSTDPQDTSKANLETKWIPADIMPKLAYDHNEIFKYVLEKLRFNILNTNIAKHLIYKEFTLSELQKIYETVLGKGMDKRNFRKKILGLNVLRDSKKIKKEGVMRPAKIYIFK
jgi:8-oxo-dGTP diphosphatase